MNCCMQDAYNLGWKLGSVLRGLARPALLNTYETERRPIAEQVIWAASSLHEIFMSHGKDIQERAKRMNDKAFLDRVVGVCSGIAYTYRDSVPVASGLAPLPGPAIGDRAPDVDLAGGGALFDATRHTGFTLLVLPGSRRAHGARLEVEITENALARVQRRFARLVRAQRLQASAALDRAYGSVLDDRLLLIRPDGYVGFHCLAGEVARLETYLGTFLIG
jgi:NADPH-dependent dioxygenase